MITKLYTLNFNGYNLPDTCIGNGVGCYSVHRPLEISVICRHIVILATPTLLLQLNTLPHTRTIPDQLTSLLIRQMATKKG